MEERKRISSHWQVPREMAGLRVDQYLQRHIGRISRHRAQRIILADDFLLDDKSVKPSSRVRLGQRATLKRFAPDHVDDIKAFNVGIVYEDDDMLVVDKPAGLSIHPTANCLYKTLTHWLRTTFTSKKINPCHRIDKETSGLVVCAKNRRSEALIKSAFMHSAVSKTYLAIVEGLVLERAVISIPLGMQKERGLVAIRMIEDHDGKMAITKMRPLRRDMIMGRSLVMCKPITGRQHQIRVHLSLHGHALVGDKLYGKPDEFFDQLTRGCDDGLKELAHTRHALHAARLSFILHNRRYIFRSPLPADLQGLIGTP